MVEGDVHFEVAARHGGVDGGCDLVEMQANKRPVGIAKNHQSNFPLREVLLVPDVLVGA